MEADEQCHSPLVDVYSVAAASNGQVSAQDPRLEPLIRGAEAAVLAWCGWHVTPVITQTLTLDGEGSASLHLPSGHVVDVSEVKVDGRPLNRGCWDFSEAGMLRTRRGRFPDRFRCVEVTLTHGFKEAPALAAVVTRSVLAACASPMGATSESAGQVSIRWGRSGMTLSEEDKADLAPYRLQSWA
ncbi:hypothetical protein [Actinomyces faecalis]|uniref:hypothetical protein n=1 Tax=Actinomyces faecalis TaxID=2722820 RepID=UPI001553B787|nr:hypothetical protein [Actinomyces faecalis]